MRERTTTLLQRLRTLGIADERLLDAVARIPRSAFERSPEAHASHEPGPSFQLAKMIEALETRGTERALVLGGNGYEAALMALLAARTAWVLHEPTVDATIRWMLRPMSLRIRIVAGRAALGLPEEAPFDVILVCGACAVLPYPLVAQLSRGGRLVAPIGDPRRQWVSLVQNRPNSLTITHVCQGEFAPLTRDGAWCAAEPTTATVT